MMDKIIQLNGDTYLLNHTLAITNSNLEVDNTITASGLTITSNRKNTNGSKETFKTFLGASPDELDQTAINNFTLYKSIDDLSDNGTAALSQHIQITSEFIDFDYKNKTQDTEEHQHLVITNKPMDDANVAKYDVTSWAEYKARDITCQLDPQGLRLRNSESNNYLYITPLMRHNKENGFRRPSILVEQPDLHGGIFLSNTGIGQCLAMTSSGTPPAGASYHTGQLMFVANTSNYKKGQSGWIQVTPYVYNVGGSDTEGKTFNLVDLIGSSSGRGTIV